MKASKYRNTNIFLIRKFIDTHTCSLEVRYGSQRQATSQVVANCIKSRYTSIKTVYTPADIIRDMKKDFGINISYIKAYRSKEAARKSIWGKPEDSYALLPSFFVYDTKSNPDSIVEFKTKEDNTFLYIFIALQASIQGWHHCIPVTVIDGLF